jgi:hypothetical protein
VWITLVVPIAVLLIAVLLQRIEAAVLTVPDAAGRPNGPRSSDPTDPDPPGSARLDPTRVDSLDAQSAPLALLPASGEDVAAPSDRPSGRPGSPRSAHGRRARRSAG